MRGIVYEIHIVSGNLVTRLHAKIILQMELLRSDNRLGSLIILLDAVHTRGESLQDGLRDVWTCETILASAYILYCLSTI